MSKEFMTEVVENLKIEIRSLNDRLKECRRKGDFSTYKMLINCYRDTMGIIEKYDFQTKFSEYNSTGENGKFSKMVSVWEQNSEGTVRNHKVWEVK